MSSDLRADSARRRVWVAAAAATALVVLAAGAAFATGQFTDVSDDNVFSDDIAWMADAGVTAGCNPPDNTEFCPDDEVTRAQMAAFMRRLARGQIVDAGSLEGHAADDFVLKSETGDGTVDHATTADHSATADQATTADRSDTAASADFARSAAGALLDITALEAQCSGDKLESGDWTKLGEVGTFDKHEGGSILLLRFDGRLEARASDASGIRFELRVDDQPTTEGTARALLRASEYGDDNGTFASFTGVFPGIAAGEHTVDIWAQAYGGNPTYATSVFYDPGCWGTDQVIVQELAGPS